jgi:ATP-dependent protease HslVU (ClpYQ) peptidase subunit
MTTIAYKDGVLAADSRITRGNVVSAGGYNKLRVLDDGSVVGGAGHTANIVAFGDWLNDGKQGSAPEMSDGTVVVHLQNDGRLFEYWGEQGIEFTGPYEAWGSGYQFALAAMYLGKSAKEAVEVACAIDSNSGLPVHTVQLRDVLKLPEIKLPPRPAVVIHKAK